MRLTTSVNGAILVYEIIERAFEVYSEDYKFSTEQMIEFAFAAHRVNNGYVKETRKHSEDVPTLYSNRDLVTYSTIYYNQDNEKDNTVKAWIPSDFIPLTVTDADRVAKADADRHMRRYTLLSLGNLTEFQQNMFSAYSSEKTFIKSAGIISFLPQFVKQELMEKIYNHRLATEFANSTLIQSNINGTIEILKVFRVNKIFEENFYIHYAAFDGNLISFTRKEGLAVGNFYNITAKIKGHSKERNTGVNVTNVNYVKFKKTEF
jgi:hypothetical protein